MRNLFSQFISLGLGAAIASKEQIEKVVNDLAAKGEINRSESKDLIKQLIQKGEEAKRELDDTIKTKVTQTLKELDLVTMDEYRKLEQRVEELEKNS